MHSYICERFIYSQDQSAYSAAGNTVCRPILGIYKLLTDTLMWIIGTEAAQFPEKEYINGIFFAVYTVNKKII